MADLPVVDGDAVKVDFFYNAPAGVQYVPRPAAPAGAGPAPLALRLLPALLPLPARDAAGDGRSNSAVGYGAGLQLRLTGWGGRRAARQRQLAAAAATAGEEGLLPVGQSQAVLPTYLSWVLRNDDNAVLAQGTVPVPTGARGWQHFSTTLKIDAAEDPRRTGHLQVRLCSAGPVPVYLDSLTVRHPRPALFISQEQHYYPFGLGLRGVAANTRPAAAISQAQYNGGSHLEDELVEAGEETSTYATPYRRYDPALGRFQGVDPLADAFADQSPGSFAGNDPANSQDPTGAYTDSNGNSTRGQDNLGIPTSRFKTARSASEGGAAGSMAGSMPYWWGGTNRGMSAVDLGLGLPSVWGPSLSARQQADIYFAGGGLTGPQMPFDVRQGQAGYWTYGGSTDPSSSGTIDSGVELGGLENTTTFHPLAGFLDSKTNRFTLEDHFGVVVNLFSAAFTAVGISADKTAEAASRGIRHTYSAEALASSAKGIANTGRVLGLTGVVISVLSYAKGQNGQYALSNISAGEYVKLGLTTGLVFAPARVALTYFAIDITVGLTTGVSVTDRIGNAVDGAGH